MIRSIMVMKNCRRVMLKINSLAFTFPPVAIDLKCLPLVIQNVISASFVLSTIWCLLFHAYVN